jgi:hypothetical protein
MMAAYFVSFSPLITCFIERGVYETKNGKIIGIIFLTPLILVFLLVFDILYVIFGILGSFTIIFIHIFRINKIKGLEEINEKIKEFLDQIFQKLFTLNSMDVKGFRK